MNLSGQATCENSPPPLQVLCCIRALGLDLAVKNKYLKTRKITFENKQKAKMCSSEYILIIYTIYVCFYVCKSWRQNFRSVFSLKIKIVMNRASLLQEREDWYLCETSSTWQRIQFCGKTMWFKFYGLVGGHRMKNQMTYIWFKLMHYKRVECDFFSRRESHGSWHMG